jgi:hypothetical protein
MPPDRRVPIVKTYEQINKRIEAGKAVVLTADAIADYVDRKGADAVAKDIERALDRTLRIEGVQGVLIAMGDRVGLAGRLPRARGHQRARIMMERTPAMAFILPRNPPVVLKRRGSREHPIRVK